MWLFKTRLLMMAACVAAIEGMFAASGALREFPPIAALPVLIYGASAALMFATRRRLRAGRRRRR